MVDFNDLVQKEAAKQQGAEAELAAVLQARREGWPRRVGELLDQIQDWIKPLIDSKALIFERESVSRSEEGPGTYQVTAASIRLGSKLLTIDPLGTFLFGAFGRVDVTGPNGKATLLLLGKDFETCCPQK